MIYIKALQASFNVPEEFQGTYNGPRQTFTVELFEELVIFIFRKTTPSSIDRVLNTFLIPQLSAQ